MGAWRAVLQAVPAAPLRVRLRLDGEWRGSEFKGSKLRGGLGRKLREMVCTMARVECAGCPELSGCAYGIVFETPVDPEVFPVLRLYEKAPHPFTLAAPLDTRRWLAAGESIEFGLTLIGLGCDALPFLIRALEATGRSGEYGGAFHVEEVRSALAGGQTLYDGRTQRLVGPPELWRTPEPDAGRTRLELRFAWPLRLMTGGRLNSAPRFGDLARGLLRRIHVLAALYGGFREGPECLDPLLEMADEAVHLETAWRFVPLERESTRQNRKLPLDGVAGRMLVEGRIGDLVPFFELGRWVQAGKATSVGLGAYELIVGGGGVRR